MPAPISLFGAFHTAVSIAPVGIGLWAFLRDGKIDLRNVVGKLYLATMLIGTLTAFGIFRHGTFTPGHALGLITLVLLVAGTLSVFTSWLGRAARYIEVFSLSASYFLLWIFTTTETLTRLPVGNPIASSPQAPTLLAIHFGLLVLFVVGLGYQVLRLRGAQPVAAPIEARV